MFQNLSKSWEKELCSVTFGMKYGATERSGRDLSKYGKIIKIGAILAHFWNVQSFDKNEEPNQMRNPLRTSDEVVLTDDVIGTF